MLIVKTSQEHSGSNRFHVDIGCPHCDSKNRFENVPPGAFDIRYCVACNQPIVLKVTDVLVSAEISVIAEVTFE